MRKTNFFQQMLIFTKKKRKERGKKEVPYMSTAHFNIF